MKKTRGFTIIEMLIVVAIIGILAMIATAAYNTYAAKSRFAEVIQAATPFKLSVEACFQDFGVLASCTTAGSNGLLQSTTAASGVVASVAVGPVPAPGAVSAAAISGLGLFGETYILVPTVGGAGGANALNWSVDPSSTCLAKAYCK